MTDIKISQLGAASGATATDLFPMIDAAGTSTTKLTAALLKLFTTGDITQLTTSDKSSVVAAINEVDAHAAKNECLVLTVSGISSLPKTVSNSNIESDMVVIKSTFSNPAAPSGNWDATTGTGTLTISGTISGTTDVTLYLMKSR